MHIHILISILLITVNIMSAQGIRPVNTYSIVALDEETGELGVAVQSHWFSVGSLVTWAQAGVGAVATQSIVKVEYGPHGLELMAQGLTANEALAKLIAKDEALQSAKWGWWTLRVMWPAILAKNALPKLVLK